MNRCENIRYDANGNLYTSGITDANGVLEFTAPPGKYYYMETAAPEGYAIDSEKHPVNIEDGRSESITAANAPIHKGSIRVKKVDAYGNTLSGAVFLLEKSTDDGQSWVTAAEQVTDENGLAIFPDLTVKDTLYRLTETKAPPGHSLQVGTIFEGTLSADQLDLSFTVCDCAIPMLPFTGSNNYIVIYFALMLGMSFFAIQILSKRRINRLRCFADNLHSDFVSFSCNTQSMASKNCLHQNTNFLANHSRQFIRRLHEKEKHI